MIDLPRSERYEQLVQQAARSIEGLTDPTAIAEVAFANIGLEQILDENDWLKECLESQVHKELLRGDTRALIRQLTGTTRRYISASRTEDRDRIASELGRCLRHADRVTGTGRQE